MASGRHVVIAVGPGRSGTSLLMQILSSQGLNVAAPPPADISNTLGNYEDRAIVALHDSILSSLHISPVFPRTLTRLDQTKVTSQTKELQEIVRANVLATTACWGFKDPRASMLIPFWNDLLRELDLSARYVLCVRNPASVIGSMRRQYGWSEEISEFRWLTRTAEPLVATNGDIFVVHYEDWFEESDRRSKLAQSLLEYVGLPVAGVEDVLKSIITPTLNRNPSSQVSANSQVGELYAALSKRGAAGRPSATAMNLAIEAKTITERFAAAAIEVYSREARDLGEQARAAAREQRQFEARVSSLEREKVELERQVASLSKEHAKELERLTEVHSSELAAHVENAARDKGRFEKRITTLTVGHAAEIARLDGQIGLLSDQRAAETAQARDEIATLTKHLESLSEQHRLQTLELKAKTNDLEKLKIQVFSLIAGQRPKEKPAPSPKVVKPNPPARKVFGLFRFPFAWR